jgi:hypothetical protein
VKLLLLALGLAVVLPLLIWTGTSLYWDIKIRMEIRELENEPPRMTPRATFVSVSGGCRALPYLVNALESTRSEALIDSAVLGIPLEVADTGRPTAGDESKVITDLLTNCPFHPNDPPDVRRKNYQQLRSWWAANRTKYHQWWRVWSSNCSRSGEK